MLTKREIRYSILFSILVILELLSSNYSALSNFHYWTKPAIVLSLIIFFLMSSHHLSRPTKILTLLALLFSLSGDILLMFVATSSNYFIGGLISFLVAHVLYIFIFLKRRNHKIWSVPLLLMLIIYGSMIFYFLNDGLGALLLPVLMYMLVIFIMTWTASLRKGKVSKDSYILVLIGALLFVASDSILALNKFAFPVFLSSLSIMLTYAIAQFMIILGITKQD